MNNQNDQTKKNDEFGDFLVKCLIRAGVALVVTAIAGPVLGIGAGATLFHHTS